jgi:precorrin-3B synthase
MSMAASVLRKGWCPGALRPMQSGDGLIVRVRPRVGRLGLDAARALADLAGRLGNGHIDLTRRANLQIRGLAEDRLDELQAELGRLGLLDADAESEAVRNVMVTPLAERDSQVHRLAEQLERLLTSDRRLRALPAKFGIVVDGDGPLSIAGERADVSLRAVEDGFALGLDGRDGTTWLGVGAAHDVVDLVRTAMLTFLDGRPRRRLRDAGDAAFSMVRSALVLKLAPLPSFDASSRHRLGRLEDAVGLAAPFGRLQARQLSQLASLAMSAGVREMHLSPWRALYMHVRDAEAGRAVLEGGRAIGLVMDGSDPLLRIEACPGAPDCASSSVDTRGDAHRLAARRFPGSVHVSGCEKGCARSAPSSLVLVGDRGRYRVIRDGTTRAKAWRLVEPKDIGELLTEPIDG